MTISASNVKSGANGAKAETVKVWDITVRIFHWSLVAAFASAWISAEEWERFHEIAGYTIGGLIVFRVLWGLIGSRHARFSDFIYRPLAIAGFIRDSIALKAKRYIGHNPAGGAMVIALLLSIAAVTMSGIAMTGALPVSGEWLEDVHEAAANFTLVLIALHIAGVLFASFEHGENLIKAMFTGNKKKP